MPKIGYIGESLDIICRQGATLGPFKATMTNPPSPDGDGLPVNLTGCIIRGQVRREPSDTTVVATLDVQITAPLLGEYQFGLTDEVTAAIEAGTDTNDPDSQYVWDLELQDSIGGVFPLYYGRFLVFREVTRP